MVLLENDGTLPLDPQKVRTIAVIGPNADSVMALEGNYNGTSSRYVTFLADFAPMQQSMGSVFFTASDATFSKTEHPAWPRRMTGWPRQPCMRKLRM